MARTEKEKMLAGDLYRADDPELTAEIARTGAWLARYNAPAALPPEERLRMLRAHLGSVADGVVIRPPFYCDLGYNIRIGRNTFLNFNCVILDIAPVEIGELTQIGPGVQILAADHPRDPGLRRALLEGGRPVRIGRNCWIGAGALILPGVTVGDDAIVGAGSVVTRDVPAGATVAGNPARPVRRSA
ncbi:sugar O-acetyltransferase [Methylobacterium nodulans]|uniref:Nodulation protein L n=1 Tax=Methylobacterium nodulans (strain LMG 21967 / CNCM I-2342 / ORS 2060) TaxID=460265 RepID=B8IQ12_METNO|nr:sugar O-acetyltransferase [Methylobacterium nodulans]ACL56662.1 acetyltransferase [Methylobacterium nodulans ORS 2060]